MSKNYLLDRWVVHFFSALVLIFVILGAARAKSGDVKEVSDIFSKMSREDILSELEYRRKLRKQEGQTRNILNLNKGTSKLRKFDDAILSRAAGIVQEKDDKRVIYGADDRYEWHEIDSTSKIRSLANASVALFRTQEIKSTSGKHIQLETKKFGKARRLCPNQKFQEQASGAYCSGTLVRPDIVLTAGHCLQEVAKDKKRPPLQSLRFVFGYHVKSPETHGVTKIPTDHIFKASKLIKGEYVDGRDWALVKLDRKVPESLAKPVTGWSRKKVKKGEPVFVIGYPSGLPLKYAPGAWVRKSDNLHYFTANLDTFGGNSGSGVFDMRTLELVGVLVRGGPDFAFQRNLRCHIVNICPSTGCRGEDVMRLGSIPMP